MPDQHLVTPPLCPHCHGGLLHDKFEDMYSCQRCYIFYYPDEVGAPNDPKAGIWTLPLPSGMTIKEKG